MNASSSDQSIQTEMPLDRILQEAKEFYKQNTTLRFRTELLRQQYHKSQAFHHDNIRDLSEKMEEDARCVVLQLLKK